MDASVRGARGSDARHPINFLARLPVFGGILVWLAGLIRLTEEEQQDAGICLGHEH
jgi:hypothetical protein